MDFFEFEIDGYLRRINYTGETAPTVATLKALHHAQFYTIPFENFDIQLGRGISLEPGAVFEKLVRKRRGGYCFADIPSSPFHIFKGYFVSRNDATTPRKAV